MRINIKRLIPTILFIALTVWYFLPELQIMYKSAISYVNSNCILENIKKEKCTRTNVKIISDNNINIAFENPPEFTFSINKHINELDLKRSTIQIYGNPKSVGTQEQKEKSKHNIFQGTATMVVVPLTIQNTTIEEKENETIFTYRYPIDVPLGSTIYANIDFIDKSGKLYHNYIFASRDPDGFSLFISGYSYYILYLIWFFAIFGGSMKRTSWGIVYNSQTKQPINRAIVRIFKDSHLIQTIVTGPTGVIFTKLDIGEYIIYVTHPKYTFPSKIFPLINDGEYKNLYYGTKVKIGKPKSHLKFNIPMDPKDTYVKPKFFLNTASATLSTIDNFNPYIVGFVALAQITIWPTYLETWVLALIGGILVTVQQLVRAIQYNEPGIIVDLEGNPIQGVKVDLYDSEWDKLVESKVTDEQGNYEFLVPNKDYYIIISGEEYKIQGEERVTLLKETKKTKNRYINSKIFVTRK